MIAILDIIATFAFALVGARIAADRRMDYGGILLIAIVASITGGTLRNLFLGERPIWLAEPWYFLAILLAVLITIGLFQSLVAGICQKLSNLLTVIPPHKLSLKFKEITFLNAPAHLIN
jgi:uncharacterized membrane protein YeiH